MAVPFTPACYPESPGCYLMKDAAGQVLYVGKAKNLRRRLAQYFQSHNQRGKIALLVQQIARIEVILVSNEVESLVLENNLIKRYRPRFNVMLNSEKHGYGYLVLTDEAFPRLLPYLKNRYNKKLYSTRGGRGVGTRQRFGPYLTREIRNKLLKCINETFGLRVCDPLASRTCFLYDLNRCLGPCEGHVTPEAYQSAINNAIQYLEYSHTALIEHLSTRMEIAAANLQFELAGSLRDLIRDLQTVFARQVVERDVKHDQDVVYLQGQRAFILHIRQGALTGGEWMATPQVGDDSAALEALLITHYQQSCPAELIVPPSIALNGIADRLTIQTGHVVQVTPAASSPAYELLHLARINYQYHAALEITRSSGG